MASLKAGKSMCLLRIWACIIDNIWVIYLSKHTTSYIKRREGYWLFVARKLVINKAQKFILCYVSFCGRKGKSARYKEHLHSVYIDISTYMR